MRVRVRLSVSLMSLLAVVMAIKLEWQSAGGCLLQSYLSRRESVAVVPSRWFDRVCVARQQLHRLMMLVVLVHRVLITCGNCEPLIPQRISVPNSCRLAAVGPRSYQGFR